MKRALEATVAMRAAVALLTIDEVSQTLRCSRRRVFELLATGTLVRGPKYGRQTVVLAESVFAALEAEYHPPPPTSEPRRVRSPRSFKAELDELAERQRTEWKKRPSRSVA